MENKPNPGSIEAIQQGCTCPVLDNNRGRGLGNDNFWIDGACPIHNGEFLESK